MEYHYNIEDSPKKIIMRNAASEECFFMALERNIKKHKFYALIFFVSYTMG